MSGDSDWSAIPGSLSPSGRREASAHAGLRHVLDEAPPAEGRLAVAHVRLPPRAPL